MVYVHTMETPADAIDKGKMRINVYDKQQGTPLADARISLAYTGNPERIINEITTDSEGAVNLDDLLTPPVEYSMEPGENQPFSEYTIDVNADGYEEINISGIDVFSGETSIQNVYLNEDNREIPENNIVIPVNTLYGSYPAKIPETEIKPVRQSGVRTSHFRNTLLMLMQMVTRRLIYLVLMYSQGKQVFRMCI